MAKIKMELITRHSEKGSFHLSHCHCLDLCSVFLIAQLKSSISFHSLFQNAQNAKLGDNIVLCNSQVMYIWRLSMYCKFGLCESTSFRRTNRKKKREKNIPLSTAVYFIDWNLMHGDCRRCILKKPLKCI